MLDETVVGGIGLVDGYPIVLKSWGSGVVDCDLLTRCLARPESLQHVENADIEGQGCHQIIGHIVHANIIRAFLVWSYKIQLAGGTCKALVG